MPSWPVAKKVSAQFNLLPSDFLQFSCLFFLCFFFLNFYRSFNSFGVREKRISGDEGSESKERKEAVNV